MNGTIERRVFLKVVSDGNRHEWKIEDLANMWLAELELAIRSNDLGRELTARRELAEIGIDTTLRAGAQRAEVG